MPEIHEYFKDKRFSEVLANLEAMDCMTSKLITLPITAVMADAKEIMRKKKISGIPVTDADGALLGLVSMEDIIKSLERGTLKDPVSKHMSKNIVTLGVHDNMNTIVEHFLTYSYGRYPVVGENKRLVGMLTKGDVGLGILKRLGNIYLHNKRREDFLTIERDVSNLDSLAQDQCFIYVINTTDLDNAGEGSVKLKKFLVGKDFNQDLVQKVSIAVYEAEINVVIHAGGKGKIRVYTTSDFVFAFVEDLGPGIADLEKAMEEGYSTAPDNIREHGFGAGMGLPNMKKFSDKMILLSDSRGTRVEMVFLIHPGKG